MQAFDILFVGGDINYKRSIINFLSKNQNIVKTVCSYEFYSFDVAGNRTGSLETVRINAIITSCDCKMHIDLYTKDIKTLDGIIVIHPDGLSSHVENKYKGVPFLNPLTSFSNAAILGLFTGLIARLIKNKGQNKEVDMTITGKNDEQSKEVVVKMETTEKVPGLVNEQPKEVAVPKTITTEKIAIPKPMIPDVINILLVAENEVDTLFLKHLRHGKFERKEIEGFDKERVYPLTFSSSNRDKINVNVIYKSYYYAIPLMDDVDGIIAVPLSEKTKNSSGDCALAYKYIERLVGSYVPTFIFNNFDSLWKKEDKKTCFIEPFSYIIEKFIGVKIDTNLI